ncbi:hypothetical protein L1887_23397 [Cichorium endivia]|nr:hypothetical protein L1887_23397 [Cichorium endivia]
MTCDLKKKMESDNNGKKGTFETWNWNGKLQSKLQRFDPHSFDWLVVNSCNIYYGVAEAKIKDRPKNFTTWGRHTGRRTERKISDDWWKMMRLDHGYVRAATAMQKPWICTLGEVYQEISDADTQETSPSPRKQKPWFVHSCSSSGCRRIDLNLGLNEQNGSEAKMKDLVDHSVKKEQVFDLDMDVDYPESKNQDVDLGGYVKVSCGTENWFSNCITSHITLNTTSLDQYNQH